MKVAVTFCAAVIVTAQGSLLVVQAPLQPANVEPPVGVAIRVTLPLNWALQVEPQSIPAGLLVTVPAPVPALLTVRG